MIKIINESFNTKDIHKFVHCIWYCIRCESGRIEKFEIEFINTLHESCKSIDIPIFIVLTQCFSNDMMERMSNSIRKLKLSIKRIVPIVAQKVKLLDFNPPTEIESFGIDELINETMKTMPS